MSDSSGRTAEAPQEGATRTISRTFTREEVEAFAELSRDTGEHHLEPDDDGRVVVHGLMLAMLPTQGGGESNVLARTMEFEFHRTAYIGEELTCELTTESVTEEADRYRLSSTAECRNETGDIVVTAGFDGVVFK